MGGLVEGVFVGRLCPIHLGHEAVIREMIRMSGSEHHCLLMIGSANSELSLRHFFSYSERRGFAKVLFPHLPIVGLPDYESDGEWLQALDDILTAAGMDPKEVVFFGGCEEDISFFADAGRKYQVLNRFDGTTPKISATEVRDCLIHDRSLDGLVNPAIQKYVKELFADKWEKFKRI